MKRIAVLTIVVALLAAFACTQVSLAEKPADQPARVLVRHLAEVIPIDPEVPDGPAVMIYRVIEISSKALDAHMGHGDMEAQPGDVIGDVIVDDPTEDPGGES